jgi:hypothetical protein
MLLRGGKEFLSSAFLSMCLMKNRKAVLITLAENILVQENLSSRIRKVYVENTSSPWKEKTVRLIRRKGHIDLKLTLWNSELFLYGRIYRLVLYVRDALDPAFLYNREAIPRGTVEAKKRELYNHIWSIYVDSRIERMGIENFFDKTLRRNLFVDMQKSLPWATSKLLFEELWSKETMTHPQMLHYAYNLDEIIEGNDIDSVDAFEIEMNRSMVDHTARKHIESILSAPLRETAHDLLSFTMNHCRGTLIEASYYGIYFMYDQEIFAEMVTTKSEAILLTLFDFQSNLSRTYVINDLSLEVPAIQQAIKTIYDRIANHSRLKAIKNPYATSTE